MHALCIVFLRFNYTRRCWETNRGVGDHVLARLVYLPGRPAHRGTWLLFLVHAVVFDAGSHARMLHLLVSMQSSPLVGDHRVCAGRSAEKRVNDMATAGRAG